MPWNSPGRPREEVEVEEEQAAGGWPREVVEGGGFGCLLYFCMWELLN